MPALEIHADPEMAFDELDDPNEHLKAGVCEQPKRMRRKAAEARGQIQTPGRQPECTLSSKGTN